MKKPTKTYKQYEIVVVPFPFTDIEREKRRPALVLSKSNAFGEKLGMSIMAMITSFRGDQNLWPSDIVIEDLKPSGLSNPSLIRFKLFTLDHRLVIRGLGKLSKKDRTKVQRNLKQILG